MISPTTAWIILGISLTLTSSAQLLAKWRMTLLLADAEQDKFQIFINALKDGYLWLMCLIMVFAVAGWYLAMARLPIGTMIVMASINTPLVAIGGWFFFGESLTSLKVFGIILVMSGVLLVGSQLR